MQINRLFEIVYILLDKKNTTAKELSEHFEVSVRTIFRDIETLTAAGIPIYTTQGRGGGISILDNFILNKAVVSEEEQNQIIFALQSLSATQHIDTKNILGKFKSLFEKIDTDWIEVDFSRWGYTAEDKQKFDILKDSIIKKQTIVCTYFSSYGEISDRKMCPLKLTFKSRDWYLQAYCLLKEDFRTFKINRMRNITILPETFSDMELHVPKMKKSFSIPPFLSDIKLKFSSNVAYRVFDEFDSRCIVKSDDGSFIVTIKLVIDYGLYNYILSFGADVEVLEPQIVREKLTLQAEKIKKIYTANKI